MGLVFRVCEPDDLLAVTMEHARALAAKPISSLVESKRAILAGMAPQIAAARQREDEAFQRLLGTPENLGKLAFFMGIENAKFRKPVIPGDQLRLEVEVIRWKTKTGRVRGIARVDGKVAAEAELTFSFI